MCQVHPPATLSIALALSIAPAPARARAQAAQDLRAEIEAAVDLPTAAARRSAAERLARARGASLDELRALCADFGRFEERGKGTTVETVPLSVAGDVEETELCVYVPARYDPAVPAPLMLSFHGTGGSGRGMHTLWARVAEETGMLVLAPSEAGENDGYRFSERERAAALAALRWVRRRYNVDENRVLASGVSRGGHLAWDLALRFPDLFAGLAPMIGAPRIQLARGQNNLRYLENVRSLPIRDLQGGKDDPGLVFNVRLAFEKLSAWGAPDAELVEFPDLGHAFDFDAVDWVGFVTRARRDSSPARVIRASAREDEARAFWVEIEAFERDVSESVRPTVPQTEWTTMGDEERRRRLARAAEERTARLEARMRAPGRFEADARGVRKLRLYLTPEMLDERGRVEVLLAGKRYARRVEPSADVLLRDFVERFDRAFLPVAEARVP